MAITHIEPSKICNARVGWQGSYINDAFMRKDAPEHRRIEINEQMAEALLKPIGWTTCRAGGSVQDPILRLCNKEYVCILAEPDRRLFVYKHDFSWYLYEVEVKIELTSHATEEVWP